MYLRPATITIKITHAVVDINMYITHNLPSSLLQPMQHSVSNLLSPY